MAQDSIDRHIAFWTRELPGLDPDVEGAVTRMQAVVRRLRHEREEALAEHGLRDWQYDVIWWLRTTGTPYQACPTWLAGVLDVRPATLTNRLERLERDGYVERIPDPDDRRRLFVRLTRKALDAWEAVYEDRSSGEHVLLAALTPEQRRQLADLLRIVTLAAEADGPDLLPLAD
ncbi:MarR family winged helix-turn-helix transcriptional regulator [Actinomadura rupiterrae]|uniref:MarR family winged helix-turn-helix transcriptional regulator n=1 Tax=Actinomadura rupiterrae TaxID=559627 RepID=UPI0020A46C34|nr:MarR family transcriptional regulator [Actinomadura rupiterrae]MCP2339431.1 DNA-binding MarR family transcriptional regulator [Actinomadura rupiterrae]